MLNWFRHLMLNKIILAALCLPHHGCTHHCRSKFSFTCLAEIQSVWWTHSPFPRQSFICFGVCTLRCVFNELFVFQCWLNSCVCLSLICCLCCLWATCLFSCLLSWLLLRSRDTAHWCLSAPWQITDADSYCKLEAKDDPVLGRLSWPQHQSSLNAIWPASMCCCCSVNYSSKKNMCQYGRYLEKKLWTSYF